VQVNMSKTSETLAFTTTRVGELASELERVSKLPTVALASVLGKVVGELTDKQVTIVQELEKILGAKWLAYGTMGTIVLTPVVYRGVPKKDLGPESYEAIGGVVTEYKLKVPLPEKSRLVGCWYSLFDNIQGQGCLNTLTVRPENDEVILKTSGTSNLGAVRLVITCLYEKETVF
jgi:hypothetical protein